MSRSICFICRIVIIIFIIIYYNNVSRVQYKVQQYKIHDIIVYLLSLIGRYMYNIETVYNGILTVAICMNVQLS